MRSVGQNLAFLVLLEESAAGKHIYWLQGNKHLRGVNFFGGHIEAGENPAQAVVREFLEEVGDEELITRWQIDPQGAPPIPTDVALLVSALKPLVPHPLILPFYSARYAQERVAHCYYFLLNLTDFPDLQQRLAWLAQQQPGIDSKEYPPVAVGVDSEWLCQEAWRNRSNPFIRAYIKQQWSENPIMSGLPFEMDLPALEQAIEQAVAPVLSDGTSFNATFIPPEKNAIDRAFSWGESLTMDMELRWGGSDQVLKLALPYPYAGVLVWEHFQDEPINQRRCYQWLPRLRPKPGGELVEQKNDIQHYHLYTYSRHLFVQVSRLVLDICKDKKLDGQRWSKICKRSSQLKELSFHVLRKRGWIQSFQPINAVDALSKLTQVIRYPYPGNVLDRMPAVARQLHPSFKGIFCPFETPESKRIGINLHLAQGVQVDVFGSLQASQQNAGAIGYAAAMVPFCAHNDAPRVMMGAKNMKQAVPIQGAEPPYIKTGYESVVQQALAPLAPLNLFSTQRPADGVNLLVAYMPFNGWNFEDGIVANRDLRDKGLLEWRSDENEEGCYIQPGWQPDNESHRDCEQGLHIVNSCLYPDPAGTIIGWFRHSKQRVEAVKIAIKEPVTLLEIEYLTPADSRFGGYLRWKTVAIRPLTIGDKLMARHGNKGVITRFEDPALMPRLPNDPQLPASLRGRAVDLVLNPNGVISRMNLGQLIETQLTLANALGTQPLLATASPILDASIREQMQQRFQQHPCFDEYGRIHLQLADSQGNVTPTLMAVMVGWQYFFRLKQSPQLKAHVRGQPIQGHNAYSPRTGQPYGGKQRGGGQRLGEMELWALAAHQADGFMQSVLTHKSDREKQTLRAIQDHFTALGFQLSFDAAQNQVSYAVADKKSPDSNHCLTNTGTVSVGYNGLLDCPVEGCDYHLQINSGGIEEKERGESYKLTLKGLLLDKGIDLDFSALDEWILAHQQAIFDDMEWPLASTDATQTVHLKLSRKNTGLILNGSVAIPDHDKPFIFNFNGRIDKNKQSPGQPGKLTLKKVLDCEIRCPKHSSKELVIKDPKPAMVPIRGGLYDPMIFGGDGRQFGAIKVAEDDFVPVMPHCYRGDLNHMDRRDPLDMAYQQLMSAIKSAAVEAIEQAQTGIKKIIVGKLKTKFGLLRRFGLGRRVNLSGRFVIVPNPEMAWDECGLSAEALIVLLGCEIAHWMPLPFQLDLAAVVREASHWQKLGERSRLPNTSVTVEERELLERFIKANPHLRLVLNRAPSLHRYSMMAFRPCVLPAEDGPVLRIHPLVCAGFGADFDGDEMSVHWPLTVEEHQEVAAKMSPLVSHNLFSVASGKPLAGFSQDFVLGFYLAGLTPEERQAVNRLLPDDCCHKLLPDNGAWDKKQGNQLIEHICHDHAAEAGETVPALMRYCMGLATRYGISFGYMELAKLGQDDQPVDYSSDSNGDPNKPLNEQVNAIIQKIAKSADLKEAGIGFALLAHSGARGGEEQIRQVILRRGVLAPGDIGFTPDDGDPFKISNSLVTGMSEDQAFWAAFNGRSSMIDKKLGTPQAGYITRQLVLAAWSWQVVDREHCGTDAAKGSVIACKLQDQQQICCHCYGDPPNGQMTQYPYPTGLIAAQSFGERGTQLSMQSFHTGKKAISLGDIQQIVRKNFKQYQYEDFKTEILAAKAYQELDERHLKIIWLALKAHSLHSDDLDMVLVGRQRLDKPSFVAEQALEHSPFLQLICAAWKKGG